MNHLCLVASVFFISLNPSDVAEGVLNIGLAAHTNAMAIVNKSAIGHPHIMCMMYKSKSRSNLPAVVDSCHLAMAGNLSAKSAIMIITTITTVEYRFNDFLDHSNTDS